VRAAIFAVVASGCDGVLGLADIHPLGIDRVAGTLREHYVANTAAGTPMTGERAVDPALVELTATLPDGSMPAVDYAADGTFTFVRESPDQPYRLGVAADGFATEYQLAESAPQIGLRLKTRPDRVPVTQPTPISIDFGSAPPSTEADVASTGVWTFSENVALNTATFDFDWQKANAGRGLLDAAKYDQLYVLVYAGFASSGSTTLDYNAIAQWGTTSITQSNGAATTASGTLMPAAQDLCVHVVALRSVELERLKAAIPPGTYTIGGANWAIHSVPDRAIAPTGLQRVAVGGQNDADFSTDIDIQAPFTNPFPGSQLLAQLQVVQAYDVMLPGTTSAAVVGHQIDTYVELDVSNQSCIANLAPLIGTVAIPQGIAMAGTPLDTDGQVIAVDPSSDVTVTWSSTSSAVDYGMLFVEELAASGTATTTTLIKTIVTATPGSAVIGRGLLQPGHTYYVIAGDELGLADAAKGDLDTVTFPFATSSISSRYFQVAP
jgi:hypothetical protein